MKLQVAGTVKGLNVEHRTPNIERRILMTLRFIYFKTSEPQNIEYRTAEYRISNRRMSKGGFALLSLFLK